tara:strand:- start:7767 stop:8213 length:447 start_codon:yes stop_codon:yes gene_type:complete
MVIVKCKFNTKIKELFKTVNVNLKELERFTNFILNEYKGTRKDWYYDLGIKMIECNTSGYYFGDDTMEIGRITTKRSVLEKRKWYLGSYFHELCHFAQDNLDSIKESKLDYSDKDASECNDKYYKNPLEIQARQWEDKYVDIYIKLFY